MDQRDIERLLHLEISATQTVDSLMDGILDGSKPDQAREALKRLANEYTESDDLLSALDYYRVMRGALSEEEFRWLRFSPREPAEARQLRRERVETYRRCRELFQFQLDAVRKQKRAGMALSHDWSQLAGYVRESLEIHRCHLMLRTAGVLFRAGIPGALDLCDAAAFSLFQTLSLQPTA